VRAKAIVAFLAASALAALLLLPAAATAKPRPASREQRPEVIQEFSLFGSRGFQVKVVAKNRRRLQFSASQLEAPTGAAGISLSGASYTMDAQQPRRSDAIVARIGHLGRIDVRFVPRKIQREKPPHGCHGGPILIEEGHYVGLIAFHGERGYTQVHAHRAPGTITRVPPLRCAAEKAPNLKQLKHKLEKLEGAEGGEEDKEAQEEDESLSVKLTATTSDPRVNFKASKAVLKSKGEKGFALTNFIASAARRRGRIEERSVAAILFEKGSTFLVPNRRAPASEAVISPSAPFSGTATFQRRRAKPPTWTGDLKVDLPGFGTVRLAGPGTHASLCEAAACAL
jgi:hypothetical protein